LESAAALAETVFATNKTLNHSPANHRCGGRKSVRQFAGAAGIDGFAHGQFAAVIAAVRQSGADFRAAIAQHNFTAKHD
jgi:hypothetical protein